MPTDQFTTSPINVLRDLIAGCAFNLAPERNDDLERLRDKYDITVGIDDTEHAFYFVTLPDEREIHLSLAALERLWAYAFAYANVIEATARNMSEGKTDVRLDASVEQVRAMQLLSWAHAAEVSRTRPDWPQELPQPQLDAPSGSLHDIANNLFLDMLGFILLHETAHIVLRHAGDDGRPDDELVADESAADEWAYAWCLGTPESPRKIEALEYTRRAFGIVLALTVIASFEVYTRRHDSRTHPDSPDRLRRFLAAYLPHEQRADDPRAFPWIATVSVLALHVQRGKVRATTAATYAHASEYALDLLMALEQHRTP